MKNSGRIKDVNVKKATKEIIEQNIIEGDFPKEETKFRSSKEDLIR